MHITNEDLKLLLEVESYLWDNNNNNTEMYLKLHKMNSKLMQDKETRNIKNTKKIAIKRQENKMYARSKKEIERHEKVKMRKMRKEVE